MGDQVAEALATPCGADVLLAGDFNGHTGSLPDFADHSALLQAALDEAAEEVLVPCAMHDAAFAPPPRASSCVAAVCEEGKALLQLCSITGLLIANGRVHGDMLGSPPVSPASHLHLLTTLCWTAGHLAAPAPASCPACSPTAPTALGRGQTDSQMAKPKATRPTPAPAGKTQRSAPPTQCHLPAPSSWRRHLAATRHLAILPCMHIIPCISPCLSFSPSALPQ